MIRILIIMGILIMILFIWIYQLSDNIVNLEIRIEDLEKNNDDYIHVNGEDEED